MDRRNNEIVQKQFYSHCIYHYRFHCRVYIAYRGMGEGIAMILARLIIPRLPNSTNINIWYLFFGLFLFEEGFIIPMTWFLLKLKRII